MTSFWWHEFKAPIPTTTLNRFFIVVNVCSAMADNGFHVVCCVVQGDSDVFKVKASVDNDVVDLKKLVYQKGIDTTISPGLAKNLTLWKVSVL